jgi:hypothetical protein
MWRNVNHLSYPRHRLKVQTLNDCSDGNAVNSNFDPSMRAVNVRAVTVAQLDHSTTMICGVNVVATARDYQSHPIYPRRPVAPRNQVVVAHQTSSYYHVGGLDDTDLLMTRPLLLMTTTQSLVVADIVLRPTRIASHPDS